MASVSWETNWGRGELSVGIFCGHNGKKSLDTRTPHCPLFPHPQTWALEAFLSPVKQGEAFPGCSGGEKSCDPGSQLMVQIRRFWDVSDMAPAQRVLAHEKTNPLQPSPCPTQSCLNSNPSLMIKRLIRCCFLHVTRVQEIILKIVRYWWVPSIFAFYNCFSKELSRQDFTDEALVTYPVTWGKRQNINKVHLSSLSRSFTLSLFITHL